MFISDVSIKHPVLAAVIMLTLVTLGKTVADSAFACNGDELYHNRRSHDITARKIVHFHHSASWVAHNKFFVREDQRG
jgi:hypothetical protein